MESRRDFLRGSAWMAVAASAAGCLAKDIKMTDGGAGAPMQGYSAPPLKKVRVGLVGLGSRGMGAAQRLPMVPGNEVTALCELRQERMDLALEWYRKKGKPIPKAFVGPDAYRRMCAWEGIDVVYSVTPWDLHAPIAVCAMENGKHVFTEVPGALTVDECWRLVETSERTHRHCMMLENCCYGEYETLCLNLVKKGILGEIVHGEAGYLHDQRALHYGTDCMWRPGEKPGAKPPTMPTWCLDKFYAEHHGNYYPTHGLGPVAKYMDINRGDRFDHLVSMESRQANWELYGRSNFPADSWQAKRKILKGDMSMTMIRTALGKTIMLQHDVMSPHPYDRLNLVSGTKGVFRGYPDLYMAWEEKNGDNGAHAYFDREKTEAMRVKYRHPLWAAAGELAKKVGGHGGMDFLMDLRWSYCLQNGLPTDTDVYDLAAWSCLVELTERSVDGGSVRVDVPDFTRGAWRTAKPFGLMETDLARLPGLGGVESVKTFDPQTT